ncbi:MAG: permease [Gorillibacterium sp.]|nr:permease [Gorillibacterium sp.]
MATHYDSFQLAIFCTAHCLNSDLAQLSKEMDFFQKHLNVSKVYVENHRGDTSLTLDRLRELKVFFEERGIEVAGGITPTLGEAFRPGYNRLFGGICYTEQASRDHFQAAVETAATVFDEIILDDFFFTNCCCDDCLEQKGTRSWEEFRLELMTEVSENLVMRPARAINPDVKIVIKYPNWKESYAASGYNTEKQPALFDAIYTGTETRDPAISQQHIPRYASYSLLRFFEHVRPGLNGGAWFDNLDCTYLDYYLEQANLSVFGKARELTLFCYSLLKDSVHVPALGHQLEKLDRFAGKLGEPIGVQVYEPHHAHGEDHLYDYLGMLGIPMELTPHFPTGTEMLLITENATRDEQIIERMKTYLRGGGQVVMTSGFLRKMRGKGVEEFTTLRPTGKRMDVQQFAADTESCTFATFSQAEKPITYPVLDYSTNGTWQSIVAMNGHNNIPVLMYDNYGKGKVYTLVVPDNAADLWKLPEPIVTQLRHIMTEKLLPYKVNGPANVGLFSYDNDSFVLESFDSVPRQWEVELPLGKRLVSLTGGNGLSPTYQSADGWSTYKVRLSPATLEAFQVIEA